MNLRARQVECERTAWARAHEVLSRLAKERAVADAVEGRWLLAAVRSAVHVHLGFGSFGEYVERLFGYKPRSTQEKLRVAEALEELPAIGEALEEGALNWSSARELTRVAVAHTEREWLDAARGKTVHQLETLVAGKAAGDLPSSPGQLSAQRHVLRFEVAAETLALFREAMNQLRRSSGVRLDDDSALMLMARHVLGGPSDTGRASYQIALSVCPECGCGSQRANGELVPVGTEVVAVAECDGQHLGLFDAAVNDGAAANDGAHTGASSEVRASSRRPSAHVGVGKKVEATSQRLSAHMGVGKKAEAISRRPSAHVGVGKKAEATSRRRSAHVGAVEQVERSSRRPSAHTGAATRPRAKQTIAPAMRRAVLVRDQHRCTVPGCRNALFLDLHHIELRSEGGGNGADNLVTLCGAHHRAAHRGELGISGRVSTGVRFRHADGSEYGHVAAPAVAETQTKVFAALRGLGFRERDVRRVLAELSRSSDEREAELESVLRRALSRLTAPGVNG